MNLTKITAGKEAPQKINVIIEISQGSGVKYEFDEKIDAIKVDRFIGVASVYPFNYGFIPMTLASDGDPLDAMVLSSMPVMPGTIISCRPIGLLEMEDEHGVDIKILAVPDKGIDPFYDYIKELKEIDKSTLERIRLFFKQYKELEAERWSKVNNFGNRQQALKIIKSALNNFQNKEKKLQKSK